MKPHQIARLLNTSRSNVCRLETNANRNIQRARNTLDFFNSLDAQFLCTVKEGSDLVNVVTCALRKAGKTGIPVTSDPVDLVNRLRADNPEGIRGRLIRREMKAYLRKDGEVLFG